MPFPSQLPQSMVQHGRSSTWVYVQIQHVVLVDWTFGLKYRALLGLSRNKFEQAGIIVMLHHEIIQSDLSISILLSLICHLQLPVCKVTFCSCNVEHAYRSWMQLNIWKDWNPVVLWDPDWEPQSYRSSWNLLSPPAKPVSTLIIRLSNLIADFLWRFKVRSYCMQLLPWAYLTLRPMCISINIKCIMLVFSPCRWTCCSHFTNNATTFIPSSWAVVKAEGKPSSSMTEQLLFGSHMVPTSAIPSVSQVVAPQRSWWHRQVLIAKSLSLYCYYRKLGKSDRTLPCFEHVLCGCAESSRMNRTRRALMQSTWDSGLLIATLFLKYIEAEGQGR